MPSLSVVTAGEGTPLLLLGGLMNPERIWSKQVRSLVANHRLIIFNKPGVGKSELRQKDLSIEGIVGDIKYVLNTLNVNSSIDIVGFSFGGMLAQQFAFEYPDMVNSMILINTAAKATKRLNNVDLLRDEVNSCPEVISINGEIDFSVAAMYGELSNNFDSREKIIQCAMPILVLSGSCDRYVDSAQSKELVSLLPNAEHKVIEARHFSLLTHPNELNQYMMNFLKDNQYNKTVNG
ncbi:MAG: alpha/beta fold hydrolase [Exilibacterium sp.]